MAPKVNMPADIWRRDASLIDHHDAMPSFDGQTSDVTFREVVAGLDPVMVPQLRFREDVGLREQLESLRTTIPDDLNQWSQ